MHELRVLGLCSYPVEAAATRFRMSQFVEPLAQRGIELDIRSFLDSERFLRLYAHGSIQGSLSLIKPLLNRFLELRSAGSYDLIFVQREAMIFGPGLFEWLHQKLGRIPLVLDLDETWHLFPCFALLLEVR